MFTADGHLIGEFGEERRALVRMAEVPAVMKQAIEVAKQIATWQATIDRWESEPSTNEGRKELIQKAKHIEAERDGFLEQYHAYEFASLLIQLGIVLSSVTLLTSIMWFSAGSIGLGLGGLAVLIGAYTKAHFVLALLH